MKMSTHLGLGSIVDCLSVDNISFVDQSVGGVTFS